MWLLRCLLWGCPLLLHKWVSSSPWCAPSPLGCRTIPLHLVFGYECHWLERSCLLGWWSSTHRCWGFGQFWCVIYHSFWWPLVPPGQCQSECSCPPQSPLLPLSKAHSRCSMSPHHSTAPLLQNSHFHFLFSNCLSIQSLPSCVYCFQCSYWFCKSFTNQ